MKPRFQLPDVVMLLAAALSAAATGQEPRNPTRQDLKERLLSPEPFKPAVGVAPALRERLERQVAEFVSQPRWAPFHEWRGISPSGLSMTEPAETVAALSLAYPYVSADRQRSILSYLERELREHEPWTRVDYAELHGGAGRNFHEVDAQDFAAAKPVTAAARRRPKLYPFWVLGQRTARWDLIELGYPHMRAASVAVPGQLPPLPAPEQRRDLKRMAELADFPRDISSLVAFARIADHFGKHDDREQTLDKLAALVPQYLALHRQIAAECRQFMDAPASKDGHPSYGGQFRNAGGPYVGRTHDAALLYWTDLCPELGALVHEYAPTASADISRWMHRNAQGHNLVRGDTPVQEGEVFAPWYQTTMNYYNLQTKVLPADASTQRLYLDAPACRGDIYFIERLVRLIEVPAAGPPGTSE